LVESTANYSDIWSDIGSTTFSGTEGKEIADTVVHKIENMTKVEAVLGTVIVSLILLAANNILDGEPVVDGLIDLLILFFIMIAVFQLLYFLKFVIEKYMFLYEQKVHTENRVKELDVKCRELDLTIQLKRQEASMVG
jgi:hypothetical protein